MGPPTGNLDWLYHLLGYTLAAAGLLLFLWALLWDRSRGRRRCPKCWYDLSGTPSRQCSECGHEAPSEQRLFRTRRRKRIAVAAVVLIAAGYTTSRVPLLQSGGWVELIPSTVVVFVAPPSNAPYLSVAAPPLAVTLPMPTLSLKEQLTLAAWSRMESGRLTRWQERAFLKRFLNANGTEFASFIAAPPKWPTDKDFPLLVKKTFIPTGTSTPLTTQFVFAHPRREGAKTITFPTPLQFERHLPVEFRLLFGKREVLRASTQLPVFIEGTTETLLASRSDDAATTLVQAALNPHLSELNGKPWLILYDRADVEPWNRIAFGIAATFEVRSQDRTIGTGYFIPQWTRSVWKHWDEPEVTWSEDPAEALRRAPLHLVVRGHPEPILKQYLAWPFDKPAVESWTGEFTVQLELRPHPGF